MGSPKVRKEFTKGLKMVLKGFRKVHKASPEFLQGVYKEFTECSQRPSHCSGRVHMGSQEVRVGFIGVVYKWLTKGSEGVHKGFNKRSQSVQKRFTGFHKGVARCSQGVQEFSYRVCTKNGLQGVHRVFNKAFTK